MNFESNTICLLNRRPSQRSWSSGGSSFCFIELPKAHIGKKEGLMLVRIALCIMTLLRKRGFLIISLGQNRMTSFSLLYSLKVKTKRTGDLFDRLSMSLCIFYVQIMPAPVFAHRFDHFFLADARAVARPLPQASELPDQASSPGTSGRLKSGPAIVQALSSMPPSKAVPCVPRGFACMMRVV
jgi:hypothetical protein